jgi:hypothetical protein
MLFQERRVHPLSLSIQQNIARKKQKIDFQRKIRSAFFITLSRLNARNYRRYMFILKPCAKN